MKQIIFDSSALIAFFRKEQGADIVEAALCDEASESSLHAVNACEIYYDLMRSNGESVAEEALRKLEKLGVRIARDMDTLFWKSVARRKAAGRISLADCFALALAERLGGELFTSDHHEFDRLATAESAIKITFIR